MRKPIGHLMLEELTREARAEVEKPFSEKLARAEQLCRVWSKTKCFVSCSFGKDSMVVLYLVRKFNPRVPVLWQNTGVEFPETVEFAKVIADEWDLDLRIVKPDKTYWRILDEQLAKGGALDDGSKHHNVCCYYLKEKPLKLFVRENGFHASFTGLTAMESRNRMFVACQRGMEYYSKSAEVTKVHPIMFWTEEAVFQFTGDMDIPLNPAYRKYGVARIGCVPCTAHKSWKKNLSRMFPKVYRHLQEKYFKQKLITSFPAAGPGQEDPE